MTTDSRTFTWYALTTAPQREFAVQSILDREGFATFVPVRREFRYVNKTARIQRRKVEKVYPLMPRYVFLGMADGTPGWGRVFCFMLDPTDNRGRAITGIIGHEGKPSPIPHAPLRDMMVRHNKGAFNAPGFQRYMQTKREFAVGDKVLTEDGLFEGRVIDITDAKARVLVEFLGAQRIVDADLERLVAAE